MIEKFQAFLDENRIRRFKAHEVLYRGASDERLRLNTDPPEQLWPNILPALRALDALRDEMGAPVTLVSIYRSPAYNRAIGGERNSYHMRFMACDFRCAKGTPREWCDVLRRYRQQGLFSGGVGTYPTFVHVDGRGYPANW